LNGTEESVNLMTEPEHRPTSTESEAEGSTSRQWDGERIHFDTESERSDQDNQPADESGFNDVETVQKHCKGFQHLRHKNQKQLIDIPAHQMVEILMGTSALRKCRCEEKSVCNTVLSAEAKCNQQSLS